MDISFLVVLNLLVILLVWHISKTFIGNFWSTYISKFISFFISKFISKVEGSNLQWYLPLLHLLNYFDTWQHFELDTLRLDTSYNNTKQSLCRHRYWCLLLLLGGTSGVFKGGTIKSNFFLYTHSKLNAHIYLYKFLQKIVWWLDGILSFYSTEYNSNVQINDWINFFSLKETEQTSVSKLKINALFGIINKVSLTRTGDRVVAALEPNVGVIDDAVEDIVVGVASCPWLLLMMNCEHW